MIEVRQVKGGKRRYFTQKILLKKTYVENVGGSFERVIR